MSDDLSAVRSVEDLPDEVAGYGAGPWFDCKDLAERAYGAAAGSNGLTMYPYLWRRFGPPWLGSDPHKELAVYYLSTRIDGLWLAASCRAVELTLCFRAVYDARQHCRFPVSQRVVNEAVQECRAELVWAMRDLLRPVFVRDVAINLFGRIARNARRLPTCPRSPYAGYGLLAVRPRLDEMIAEDGL